MEPEPSQLASPEDLALVERLRAGDEEAFDALLRRHQTQMLRVARMYVSSQAVAEEVVQEAWVGILQGLARFEGRSTLRTWMFRILTNIAKTRGQREGRSVPFSALAGDDLDAPAMEDSWFRGATDRWPGSWASLPDDWRGIPDERLLGQEVRALVGDAIDGLPPMQARVIELRDVRGWSSAEVCNALEISETNQRVLLHRARARVRHALGGYLEKERP